MGRSFGLFLGLMVAMPAMAYPTPVDFDGTLLRWEIESGDAPITYEIIADLPEDAIIYESAVDEAAALWTNVPTSYFEYIRAVDGVPAQVSVYLQNALEGAPYSSGYAIFDEIEPGVGPKHCSLYVGVGTTGYQGVAKTLLHEFGHCLGLGHTLIPQAIMSYRLEENSFALDLDDEAGVTRHYPADGSRPKLPPGCATGEALGGTSWLLLLMMMGPLVLWRRFQLPTATPSEASDHGPAFPALSTARTRP